jgi:bifunctional oligoribonuclease and PAP phosphatase NrnA
MPDGEREGDLVMAARVSGGAGSLATLLSSTDELDQAIEGFVQLVDQHQKFLIVSHTSPDGDAVGSSLALAAILSEQGKDVTVYNRDPVPYNFAFLPGADRWVQEIPETASYDVTVLLDCAEPDRIGEDFPEQGWGEVCAVVDHHRTWDPSFADLYVRDESAAATGELLFRVATRVGDVSLETAQNLYCCLMTDTGSFRYSNTTRAAFRIAGELVQIGVDPWEMTSQVYENQPRERLDLLCQVLTTLSVSSCGRLAFLRVERSMLEEHNGDGDLTDGFINYARSIRGVEVATQLREVGDGSWRVSFRSRGKVDVSALAQRFGGGGHHNAAGCTIAATPEEIEADLAKALVELLATS